LLFQFYKLIAASDVPTNLKLTGNPSVFAEVRVRAKKKSRPWPGLPCYSIYKFLRSLALAVEVLVVFVLGIAAFFLLPLSRWTALLAGLVSTRLIGLLDLLVVPGLLSTLLTVLFHIVCHE
jgi:hypothetical protein